MEVEEIPFDNINRIDKSSLISTPIEYTSMYRGIDIESSTVTSTDGVSVSILPSLKEAKDVTINSETLTILTNKKQVGDVFVNQTKSLEDIRPLLHRTSLKIYRFNPEVTTDTYTTT